MEELLTSSVFRYVMFPAMTAIMGVAVKYVTRNDRFAQFKKEDMAIGLELILIACLMYVVLTTDRAIDLKDTNNALASVLKAIPVDQAKASALQTSANALSEKIDLAGWIILLMVIGLWSISTIVRKWGWASATELKPIIGIALPLVFGFLALILVMAGATP